MPRNALSFSVGVFDKILDPEFENDTSAFEETFMGAIRSHNLWMTPKEHVLVHHVPNMCAVPEFHSDIPLSRRRRFSIDFVIFSASDAK